MVTLFSELGFPAKPESKICQQIINLIENHLELAQSKFALKREQLQSELISQYVTDFNKIAQTCIFGIHLEKSL